MNALVRLGIVGCGVVALAGCGAAAQAVTTTAPAPQHPFACDAVALGAHGQWAAAQHRWLSAETTAKDDPLAAASYMVLGMDSAMLAADQMTGAPQTVHLATYQSDLSGDAAYTAGC